MYYGDAIASYKQVTYSDASITISLSLIQAVDPSGKGSATRVLLNSTRFSASSMLSCKSSMLHYISLFKHVLQKRYEVRTDGQVAVFVRESASLVTGKTDKMDTGHKASSVWTDLAR